MQPNLKYKRILLKLSGEVLMGQSNNLFDKLTIDKIIQQIKQLRDFNVQIGLVIGGGNIFRGMNGDDLGVQRANADYMGMLATVMNGIALKDFLTTANIPSKIYSALTITNMVKGYNRDSMLSRVNDGNVIIFVGGTGNPFFTTDSGAALRAIDMNAQLLIKATKVDGVYASDPLLNPQAKKYNKITFDEVMNQNLKVMDMTAFDLCRTHKINIMVCDIFQPTCLIDAVTGKNTGTLIYVE